MNRPTVTKTQTMKQLFISPLIALSLIIAPVLLSSCGEDAQNAAQGGGVQIDPAVRKAAMAKLQELGIEFSPVSFAKQLSGNCKAEILQCFFGGGHVPQRCNGQWHEHAHDSYLEWNR